MTRPDLSDASHLPAAPLRLTRLRPLVLAAVLGLALGGCVVAPWGYGPPDGPRGDVGVRVDIPPPPAQVEAVPLPPALGWLWIGGYWGWQLGRHVWIGGRWVAPRPGYEWSPHRWERDGRGWRPHGGYWSRR